MKIEEAQFLNGGMGLFDADEDAPLVTVFFHNEAAKLDDATKWRAIRKLRETLRLDYGPSLLEGALKVAWSFRNWRWPWSR